MKTDISGCDGCVTGTRRPDCIYASFKNCPCINCLIKMMCEVACDALSVHYHKVTEAESKGD